MSGNDAQSGAASAVGTDSLVQRLAWLVGESSVGRYAAIGCTGVTLDALIFAALVGLGMAPVPASMLGTLAGVGNNYVWNARLNFRIGLSPGGAARFVTVGVVGLVASALLVQTLLSAGLGPFAAKAVVIPLVVLGQFLANRAWTFRSGRPGLERC